MSSSEIIERLAKIETVINYHEARIEKLEDNINDLSHKISEVIANQNKMMEKFVNIDKNIENMQTMLTMKGIKWMFEKVLIPVIVAAVTALVLSLL